MRACPMVVALCSGMYYARRFVNAYETPRVVIARAGTLAEEQR